MPIFSGQRSLIGSNLAPKTLSKVGAGAWVIKNSLPLRAENSSLALAIVVALVAFEDRWVKSHFRGLNQNSFVSNLRARGSRPLGGPTSDS
jgi:hypothetical protein